MPLVTGCAHGIKTLKKRRQTMIFSPKYILGGPRLHSDKTANIDQKQVGESKKQGPQKGPQVGLKPGLPGPQSESTSLDRINR